MADSDKDILITPNVSQTSQPEIKLVGKDNSPMYLKVLDDNTLSFEGTEGQVFSIGHTMSTGDIFSVSDISGVQNMVVTAEGIIKIIPTGVKPSSNLFLGDLRHCFVYARGTGNNNGANSLVYLNGNKVVDSATRGLNLTIINQVNLNVISSTNYDTFANQTNNDNLATAIGNMTDQQIGILVSEDAWETSNTTNSANLVAAAKLVGLTKLGNIGDGNSSNRRPYAAIFMGSGDDANAANKFVIERMSDADADAPMASISAVLVSDGTHASIMGSNNVNAIWGADSNHEEPALIADEDNNIDILGGSGGNGQVNISRTSGATVFLQAQSATGIVGTSSNHTLALATNGSQRLKINNVGGIEAVSNANGWNLWHKVTFGKLDYGTAAGQGSGLSTLTFDDNEVGISTYTLPRDITIHAVAIRTQGVVLSGSTAQVLRIFANGDAGSGTLTDISYNASQFTRHNSENSNATQHSLVVTGVNGSYDAGDTLGVRRNSGAVDMGDYMVDVWFSIDNA